MDARKETEKVRRAATKAALAREQMICAMRDARTAGVSLRDVAAAANVSHETARKLTQIPD